MKLFGRKTRKREDPEFDAVPAPEVPFYAVGDVHGADAELVALLARLDGLSHPEARLVMLGDYVDRGDDSRMVLMRLHRLSEAAGGLMVCLMGNHERMLLDVLEDPQRAGPRWLRHGGLQTLASYGVPPPPSQAGQGAWLDMRDALHQAMGPALVAWLHQLPLLWQSGNVVAVHAALDPDWPPDAQDEQDMLWGHGQFRRRPRRDGIWVVHGHTIVDRPQVSQGVVSVDTGAYATGVLTAALIRPGGVEFVQSQGPLTDA